MKASRILLGAALLGALGLAAISETGAQFGGGGGGRRGGSAGSRDSGGERSETTPLSANDQIRMQLTNARLALKLAPEQNPPWQSYEDKVIALIAEQPQSASDQKVVAERMLGTTVPPAYAGRGTGPR